MTQSPKRVTKEELVKELAGELHYHSNGGTTYRQDTTRMALEVARQLADTSLFYNRTQSLSAVRSLLRESDEHRLLDVSKMLSVVTRDLHRKKTLPGDVKAYVEVKRKQKKPLTFV